MNSSERKALFSTLWIFVLLNVIFRDIHELFRPGMLEAMMSGTFNGVALTEGTLLVAGMMLELPILMVLLSRVLPYALNRWANIIIPVLTIVSMIANGINDLDDIWFLSIGMAGLAAIVYLAWQWRDEKAASTEMSRTAKQ